MKNISKILKLLLFHSIILYSNSSFAITGSEIKNLVVNFLEDKGHVVINNLGDDDIDIILITEPRRTSESSAFTHVDVLNYLSL